RLLRRVSAERGRHHRDRIGRAQLTRAPGVASERQRDAARIVDESVAIAALIAHPPVVHGLVEPRLEARDTAALRVMRPAPVDVDLDVAAARAARTHRLRRVEVPDAHLEAEVAIGQRAHGTDVDDVAGILVLEIRAGEEADLRVIATIEDAELARLRDLVAEAHAARAEDAALGVEHDVTPERHRLRLVNLLVRHPRVVEAVL